jgi:flagellin
VGINIQTNIFALSSQRQLSRTTGNLAQVLERLATGRRINRASDDAAGLQIAAGLTNSITTGRQAVRNINDGISKTNIAEGAFETATNITQRLGELAQQSANGTISDEQRSVLNDEFQQLTAELDRIDPQFNGQVLGTTTTIQSGNTGDASSQTEVQIGEVSSQSLSLDSADISTQAGAQAALTATDNAIQDLGARRGSIGALQSRLSTQLNNLASQNLAQTEARSRITDADIASETANFLSLKIQQQANVAILGQANSQPSLALRLLQS